MCDKVSSLGLGVDPGTVGASLRDKTVHRGDTPLIESVYHHVQGGHIRLQLAQSNTINFVDRQTTIGLQLRPSPSQLVRGYNWKDG